MCTCYFFFLNIFGFFFLCPLFLFFHWKKVPSPQRERPSQSVSETRGETDKARWSDEGEEGQRRRRRRRDGGPGLRVSFSLLSLAPLLSLAVVRLSGSWWLRVELLLLVRLLVGDGGLLGLLQCVAALVLLLHPVHQQHHQEGGEHRPHHAAHDDRWGTGREHGLLNNPEHCPAQRSQTRANKQMEPDLGTAGD